MVYIQYIQPFKSLSCWCLQLLRLLELLSISLGTALGTAAVADSVVLLWNFSWQSTAVTIKVIVRLPTPGYSRNGKAFKVKFGGADQFCSQ